MDKLKTLQDLELEHGNVRTELKQEAIKWIKSINSLDGGSRENYLKFCADNFPKESYELLLDEQSLRTLISGLLSISFMFEHFFNIKEDLSIADCKIDTIHPKVITKIEGSDA